MLHYGLLYFVNHKGGKWSWDKHWYHGFDVHKCPPWDLAVEHPQEGLFPQPPGPDDLLPTVSRQGTFGLGLYAFTCLKMLSSGRLHQAATVGMQHTVGLLGPAHTLMQTNMPIHDLIGDGSPACMPSTLLGALPMPLCIASCRSLHMLLYTK